MPPLPGFSDNPFQSRQDLVNAAVALLKPLTQFFSPDRARIQLHNPIGSVFDENAGQLEGFARPLWAVASLVCMAKSSTDCEGWVSELAKPWIEGISAGTNPQHPEYWGSITDLDQRMVETEMISFALLMAPSEFFLSLDLRSRSNLIVWLSGINGKEMPRNNWRWFRVFVNLALWRVCGIPLDELQQHMEEDLAVLDSLYLDDGWSADGPWLTAAAAEEERRYAKLARRRDIIGNGRQADYYSGSFAIQFSQLLYVRFAADIDPVRVEIYRQKARDYGKEFWRYFNSEGAAIPFGRSLTYRFACGGFFAALAFAGVQSMPDPLSSPGSIKGFLLRHLRWWASHSQNIFDTDGTLNLGYIFPNMYMTENYNSPQSVYWCLKSLIVVALDENDHFWASQEVAYPRHTSPVELLKAPVHILCNRRTGNHHFLLSAGQFVSWPLKAGQAKYGKFAYSSSFTFSVPTGPLISQLAPDNNLALSRDGAITWAVKSKCSIAQFHSARVEGSSSELNKVPTISVDWHPWEDEAVHINSTLIPPTARWPDWHIRLHRIRVLESIPAGTIHAVEGGFAVPRACTSDKSTIPILKVPDGRSPTVSSNIENQNVEAVYQSRSSILVLSSAGASGICADVISKTQRVPDITEHSPLMPDANTNLQFPRTIIPTATHDLLDLHVGSEFFLLTKVFAVTNGSSKSESGRSIMERWLDVPQISFDGSSIYGKGMSDTIFLQE